MAAYDGRTGANYIRNLRARNNCDLAEILFLNLRAWQLRGPLRLNQREQLMTRGEISGWSMPDERGLVSSGVALVYREKIEWMRVEFIF